MKYIEFLKKVNIRPQIEMIKGGIDEYMTKRYGMRYRAHISDRGKEEHCIFKRKVDAQVWLECKRMVVVEKRFHAGEYDYIIAQYEKLNQQ